jgi:hypothetical protein
MSSPSPLPALAFGRFDHSGGRVRSEASTVRFMLRGNVSEGGVAMRGSENGPLRHELF